MPKLKESEIQKAAGCWFYNLKTNAFHCSDQLTRILPCDEDIHSRSIYSLLEIMKENGGETWLQDFQDCRELGGVYFSLLQFKSEDQVKWVEAKISSSKDEKGEIFLILGTFIDVTDQRGTEQELKSTQNLLKTILDYMPGPVYSKDSNGDYVFVNKRFMDSVNMKVIDPIGKNDFEIFDTETAAKLRKNDEEVVESRSVQESVEVVPHLDGSLRTYESFKFPTFDQFGIIQTVTGISFDVTEKQRIKSELELERSRLIQASKMTALGEMAGGVAHEINNPLAIIKGYTLRMKSMFYGEPGEKAEKSQKIADDILRAVERTEKIILGFRNFARDPSNEKFQKVSVEKVIRETMGLCNARFAEYQVELEEDLKQGLFVECLEVHISQVLVNLLGNALDATIEMGGEDSRRVLIKSNSFIEKGREYISIQVIDWGRGFAPEARRRFMEPFYSTKAPGKGTGLGLSISKGLVEKHNGKLILASDKAPTVLEVQLPVEQPVKDENDNEK